MKFYENPKLHDNLKSFKEKIFLDKFFIPPRKNLEPQVENRKGKESE